MTDAHEDIAHIDTTFSGGGLFGEKAAAGETITMVDGSVWFHPFDGRAPTRLR